MRLPIPALALIAVFVLTGCPDGEAPPVDVVADAGAGADVALDAGTDGVGEDSGGADATPPDAAVDTPAADVSSPPDVALDTGGPACDWPIAVPEDPPDPARTKFALVLFHFNIQYVAGGLWFVDENGHEQTALPGAAGWDEAKVEDWIVRETFAPVIDFYLEHPTWKANIELQAYMVDVLAERHPDVLDKLRMVTSRGQVELMSFHYSDQLFLAFPREDMERSIAATKETFRRHCLPLAGSVFDQEGQAGEGRQDLLVQEGYTVGVFPKNLWIHQHGDSPRWPYYRSRGGDLIVGPGGVDPASGITVEWLFFDDGELLAPRGEVDPYFAHAAQHDPENLVKYGARIAAKEADGFRIAHVSDYVRHLKARGVEQPEAPPLLDGTWQPRSTRSILRWLGGRGIVWGLAERDNEVRTGNARARTELLLAETLRDHARGQGVDTTAADALLAAAWVDLWFAQVSDATGINPWLGEIVYGLRHNAAVEAQAAAAIGLLKTALSAPWVAVDSASGAVTVLADQPLPEPPAPLVDPPFEPVVRAPGRTVTVAWFEDAAAGAVLEIAFSAAQDPPPAGEDVRRVEVAFPRTEDHIRYSPGLLDDEVRDHPFDDFAWSDGEFFLPLGNGLLGLGDGVWLVKDTRAVHLAVRIAPDDPFVRFGDETFPPGAAATWRFAVIEGGAEDALAVAHEWNVRPHGVR
jgi:hypothetical protein